MSTPYPKIPTVWNRDPATKYKTLIQGSWATPEIAALKDLRWNAYEKVDGTNIRVIFFPDLLGEENVVEVRGRTDKAQIPPHLMEELAVMFYYEFFLEHFDLARSGGAPICLYGEGFGPKIQNGGKYCARPDFCLFDVKIGDVWMDQDFVSTLALQAGLQRAPLLARGSLENLIYNTWSGFNSSWGDFLAEGYIVRPPVDLMDRFGNRIIGKIKTKDFADNQ